MSYDDFFESNILSNIDKAFDESKHPREHGKFSSQGNAYSGGPKSPEQKLAGAQTRRQRVLSHARNKPEGDKPHAIHNQSEMYDKQLVREAPLKIRTMQRSSLAEFGRGKRPGPQGPRSIDEALHEHHHHTRAFLQAHKAGNLHGMKTHHAAMKKHFNTAYKIMNGKKRDYKEGDYTKVSHMNDITGASGSLISALDKKDE